MRVPALPALIVCFLMMSFHAVAKGPDDPESSEIQTLRGDRIEVFGESIHIRSNEYLRGMILSIGGDVTIDGEVDDQVVVIFGSLKVRGTIDRDTVTVLSDVELDGAKIDGQLVHVLGSMTDRDSTILGDRFNLGLGWGGISGGTRTVLIWLKLFHKLLIFLFLIVLAALAPARIRVMGDEAPLRYLVAVFVGLAAYVVIWALILLLLPTVVGSLGIWIAFIIVKWLGVAGLFFALGRRLGRVFGVADLSVLGAVVLTFAFYVALTVIPAFFGWAGFFAATLAQGLFFLLIEAPGLGIALHSRLGSSAIVDSSLPTPPTPGHLPPPTL